MNQYIDIVLDGPPSHVSGRFVEVENEHGQSISVGEWIAPKIEDGLWRLRIKQEPTINALAEMIHNISTSKGFAAPSMENLPTKLMLSVSELAEAMEEHRKERGLRYIAEGKPEGILVELADSVIRNLHMMWALMLEAGDDSLKPGAVIREKVEFNDGRPHMHGGNIY